MRQINEEGLALIKAFEGLRLKAYQDSVGVWTIGYGHTRGVKKGMTISANIAEALLLVDLRESEHAVEALVKVPLMDNQFAALVSFTFNLGQGNLKRSTLLRKLNQLDYPGAAAEFPRWNKAGGKVLKGLTKRRAAEQALFSKVA